MADNNEKPIQVSDRALEMVMRDVLDGMLELSLSSAYTTSCAADFQIIEVAPERDFGKTRREKDFVQKNPTEQADILPFPPQRKAAC